MWRVTFMTLAIAVVMAFATIAQAGPGSAPGVGVP